jgi:hypothetical protein
MNNIFYLKKIGDIKIISFSKEIIKNIKRALEALKYWDKIEFKRVNKNLKKIIVLPDVAVYNYLDIEKRAWVSGYELFEDKDCDVPYIASLLIHEAHHIAQSFSGNEYFGERAEKNAYLRQRSFLKKINYDYAVEWLDEQYKKEWWKEMDEDVVSKNKFKNLISSIERGQVSIKELKEVKI